MTLLSDGVIVLGISQLIAFGVFSIKVMWNYKKELGKAHQRIDELEEYIDKFCETFRDYEHLNNQNVGHIQDFLCNATDYKPPTLSTRSKRRNY